MHLTNEVLWAEANNEPSVISHFGKIKEFKYKISSKAPFWGASVQKLLLVYKSFLNFQFWCINQKDKSNIIACKTHQITILHSAWPIKTKYHLFEKQKKNTPNTTGFHYIKKNCHVINKSVHTYQAKKYKWDSSYYR